MTAYPEPQAIKPTPKALSPKPQSRKTKPKIQHQDLPFPVPSSVFQQTFAEFVDGRVLPSGFLAKERFGVRIAAHWGLGFRVWDLDFSAEVN